MKRPDYTEQLFANIFGCLGWMFLAFGVLDLLGIMTPSQYSKVQSGTVLGTIFTALGILFILTQFIFARLGSVREKTQSELLAGGTKVSGTVENVYLQRTMQYGHQSPWRVCYTYTWQGEICRGKSGLLWEKPQVKENDAIEVYVNEAGKTAVEV